MMKVKSQKVNTISTIMPWTSANVLARRNEIRLLEIVVEWIVGSPGSTFTDLTPVQGLSRR